MSVILALNLFAAIGLLLVVVMIQGLAYHSRGSEYIQSVGEFLLRTRLLALATVSASYLYILLALILWAQPLDESSMSFIVLIWVGGLVGLVLDMNVILKKHREPLPGPEIFVLRLEHDYQQEQASPRELRAAIETLNAKAEQLPMAAVALQKLAVRDDLLGQLARETIEEGGKSDH